MITAVASFVEGTVALAAAVAAAGVLVLRDPRARAWAMPVALLLALGAVALISGSTITDDVSGRAALVAAAGAVGLLGVLGAGRRVRPAPGLVRARGDLHAAVPDPGPDRERRHREPAPAALRRARRGRARAPVAGVARRGGGRAARRPAGAAGDAGAGDRGRALRAAGALLERPRARGQDARLLLRAVRDRVPPARGGAVVAAAGAAGAGVIGRTGAAVRGGRVRRVGDRAAADLEREGALGQRPQALLQGQLAVLRPERLRALPRAGDGGAGGCPAVGAGAARRGAGGGRAGAAVGGARAHAVGVELRGAARRAGGAGGAALALAAGAGGVRRRRWRSGSRSCCWRRGSWASTPTRSRR